MPYGRDINLHPSDHLTSSLKSTTYDVIIIGGGAPSGWDLSLRTGGAGLSTAIVEGELVGGECRYFACTPSKALLRAPEVLAAARQVGGARELTDSHKRVDVEAVFQRRDKFTDNWTDDLLVGLAEKAGVTVVRGWGSLSGEKKVKVKPAEDYGKAAEEIELTARLAVVVATGSSPVIPKVSGLSDIEDALWTPREATAANKVPSHLLILGGGVVGCEMATFYSAAGGKVTLVTGSTLLPQFEPEAGKRVQASLEERGVNVKLHARLQSVEKLSSAADNAGNTFKALLSTKESIEASTLLIATGRKPNTADLNLSEHAGIPDAAKVSVDETLRVTTAPWLYVVGDANTRNMVTHMAQYQARIVFRAIVAGVKGQTADPKPWNEFAATADHDAVPQVVVTDPHVASVGLTLAQARKRGLKVKAVSSVFDFPGAWVHGEFNYDGWAQWVIDTERHVLVGATFVGREAGDLLHPSTVALVGEVTIPRLW